MTIRYRAVAASTSRRCRYRYTPMPKPEVSRSSAVPTAATVVSSGASSSGNPMRNSGISSAAPLIPLNIATLAMAMHAGSMNQ
jgi:hypothetical protein